MLLRALLLALLGLALCAAPSQAVRGARASAASGACALRADDTLVCWGGELRRRHERARRPLRGDRRRQLQPLRRCGSATARSSAGACTRRCWHAAAPERADRVGRDRHVPHVRRRRRATATSRASAATRDRRSKARRGRPAARRLQGGDRRLEPHVRDPHRRHGRLLGRGLMDGQDAPAEQHVRARSPPARSTTAGCASAARSSAGASTARARSRPRRGRSRTSPPARTIPAPCAATRDRLLGRRRLRPERRPARALPRGRRRPPVHMRPADRRLDRLLGRERRGAVSPHRRDAARHAAADGQCSADRATLWPPTTSWCRSRPTPSRTPAQGRPAWSCARRKRPAARGRRPGLDAGAATTGLLRAERDGGRARRYALTYRGFDRAGNAADCTATVTVPTSASPRGDPPAAQPRSRRASATSVWTPQPEPPLPAYGLPLSHAVPAMSRCAHGTSPTKRSRNSAAVIEPALRLSTALTMSA